MFLCFLGLWYKGRYTSQVRALSGVLDLSASVGYKYVGLSPNVAT